MVVKVGINGFGRVGRIITRSCLQNPLMQLSAINDPSVSIEYMCYLIKYDSTHGKLKSTVTHTDNEINVDDVKIKVFHEKTPQNIPWTTAGVEYIVEASGMFTNLEKASGHLISDGVKRVILTAPSVDVPMLIIGVNENKIRTSDKVISCTSSTLYCLAPIIKILEDNFGIVDGFMTSIHAMTPSMKPLDGLCLRGKYWRDHRSIHQNIIPAATGACKALGKIIPEAKDKISGLAFRVPVVNVSILDLCVRLNTNTTLSNIANVVEKTKRTYLSNIITVSYDEAVSSDFNGETHSCVLDVNTSLQLKPNYYKIVCWYENEYSYACRVMDTILFSEKQFSTEKKTKNVQVKTVMPIQLDEVLQTDLQREISVNCDNALVLRETTSTGTDTGTGTESEGRKWYSHHTQLKKTFRFGHSGSCPNYRNNSLRNNDVFNVWSEVGDGKKTVAKNKSSFFQSRSQFIPPGNKAKEKLEIVKKEFSKMVNITENILKKSQCRSQIRPDGINGKDSLSKHSKFEMRLTNTYEVSNNSDKNSLDTNVDELYILGNNDETTDDESMLNVINYTDPKQNMEYRSNVSENTESFIFTESKTLIDDLEDSTELLEPNEIHCVNSVIFVSNLEEKLNLNDIVEEKVINNNEVKEDSILFQENLPILFQKSSAIYEEVPQNEQFQPNEQNNLGEMATEEILNEHQVVSENLLDLDSVETISIDANKEALVELRDDNLINWNQLDETYPSHNDKSKDIVREILYLNIDGIFKERNTKLQDVIEKKIDEGKTSKFKEYFKKKSSICNDLVRSKSSNSKVLVKRKSSISFKDVREENNVKSVVWNKEVHQVTDKELTIDIALDEKLHISKIDMNINTIKEREFAKQVSDRLKKIRPINRALESNKYLFENNMKIDIYDKLDSASGSDSSNEFDINERKSEVIHLTDLCGSLEDMEKLHKICRIIEVSDELSDRLFSPLTTEVRPEIKPKRWSFKDLCTRIKLDEFCNSVFGSASK